MHKGYDEDLGIEFGDDLFDRVHICKNKCVFCFLYQQPKGLRSSLYIKDDDYRLSFLHGNYLTLTNMGEDEFQRVIGVAHRFGGPDVRVVFDSVAFVGGHAPNSVNDFSGGIQAASGMPRWHYFFKSLASDSLPQLM